MKHTFTLLIALLMTQFLMAQSGEITGRVTDENGDGIPFANISIVDGGVPTGQGATSDFDGNYSIKPLTPGRYDVQFRYLGYNTRLEKAVIVSSDKISFVDVKLSPQEELIDVIDIVEYRVPLIDPGATSTQSTLTQEEIDVLPTRNIESIASSTANVYQADENGALNVKGQRSDGTEVFIDGIRVRGSTALPSSAIEQLTVITGGIPAKYGNATGGIINITTRGPSRQFGGGVEVITSQYLDAYGYNLINGTFTGPIVKDKKNNRPVLGYFIAAEYERQKDRDPSAIGNWVAKEDVLANLEQNPIQLNSTGDGFILSSETITLSDLENIKYKPNSVIDQGRLSINMNYRISDNVNLTVGGSGVYSRYHQWVRGYTLLNPENNPLTTSQTYRGFARLTHNIGKRIYSEEDAKEVNSAIQNAYYSVQVDYEKFLSKTEDDSHGDRYFDYGHIGNFETFSDPVFETPNPFVAGSGEVTLPNGDVKTGVKMVGLSPSLVTFTPGTANPKGTAFTQAYYDLAGEPLGFYQSLSQIEAAEVALINGQRSGLPHGVWFNSGRQWNGSSRTDLDQFRIKLEGAFDILPPGSSTRNKHAIEFGVEFEQRIDRYYTVSPLGLWQRMRQLANQQIGLSEVPTFLIDGVEYQWDDPLIQSGAVNFGITDTMMFAQANVNPESQTNFDRNLRAQLGLAADGDDFVDIDNLDPSVFDINMFSPDELFLDGSQLVRYFGYSHTGDKLKTQPSFNEFFTKKNADDVYERGIPAFQPIYTSAYIADKFQFKDLTFNVGVRIDRFDANQKVLRDPYSLYKVRSVSEVEGTLNPEFGAHPENVAGDFAVYVNDFKSNTPSIVGYRDGDQWYDAQGNQITNAAVIEGAGGQIQPYLVNSGDDIKARDGSFDPNNSFKDYEPQITVMPRLQFSFNLTDRALFFAHYDILSQRPQTGLSNGVPVSRMFATPDDWLFFEDNIGGVIANPDLKPEKTIDFQLGFKQRVSNSSAITISAFYREFKDMVQVTEITFAYPRTYRTFGNKDFGTSKGFSVDYDLRRTGNIRMTANYSIQFAQGTGSNDASQFSLIDAGQPNLRTISPLDFDARHTVNVSFDYRYARGKNYNGPLIKNNQILADAGINLRVLARSGTPFTKQSNATPEGLSGVPTRSITQGSLNGSRLPWTFRVNAQINKAFAFNTGKKNENVEGIEDAKSKRALRLNVYLQVVNLLNAQNIVNVYRFTGNPGDDGFLTDPVGQQTINTTEKISQQSFVDLYSLYVNNPNNYARPRTIRLGAEFSF